MLIRDHFQNFKSYQLPKAQLIIADVPYNLGNIYFDIPKLSDTFLKYIAY